VAGLEHLSQIVILALALGLASSWQVATTACLYFLLHSACWARWDEGLYVWCYTLLHLSWSTLLYAAKGDLCMLPRVTLLYAKGHLAGVASRRATTKRAKRSSWCSGWSHIGSARSHIGSASSCNTSTLCCRCGLQCSGLHCGLHCLLLPSLVL